MISVSINNEWRTIEPDSSLQNLITQYTTGQQASLENARFAVAINGEFVPRSAYEHTSLKEGDTIDIVSPIGGG